MFDQVLSSFLDMSLFPIRELSAQPVLGFMKNGKSVLFIADSAYVGIGNTLGEKRDMQLERFS